MNASKTAASRRSQKKATITPIYKKSDVLHAANYRAISVTTSFSKIVERTLHKEITRYVENKGLLTPFRFRFRSGVSSQDAIVCCVETLCHEIENDDLVHAVFLDLPKAFDSVSHENL